MVGLILFSMVAHSVSTDRIAHAQEQSSPTLPNSDARHQADIVFWQAIMHSSAMAFVHFKALMRSELSRLHLDCGPSIWEPMDLPQQEQRDMFDVL